MNFAQSSVISSCVTTATITDLIREKTKNELSKYAYLSYYKDLHYCHACTKANLA